MKDSKEIISKTFIRALEKVSLYYNSNLLSDKFETRQLVLKDKYGNSIKYDKSLSKDYYILEKQFNEEIFRVKVSPSKNPEKFHYGFVVQLNEDWILGNTATSKPTLKTVDNQIIENKLNSPSFNLESKIQYWSPTTIYSNLNTIITEPELEGTPILIYNQLDYYQKWLNLHNISYKSDFILFSTDDGLVKEKYENYNIPLLHINKSEITNPKITSFYDDLNLLTKFRNEHPEILIDSDIYNEVRKCLTKQELVKEIFSIDDNFFYTVVKF